MELFTELLKDFAFPIVCCIAVGYFSFYMVKQYMSDVHNMMDCINNNTNAIENLTERLDNMKGE